MFLIHLLTRVNFRMSRTCAAVVEGTNWYSIHQSKRCYNFYNYEWKDGPLFTNVHLYPSVLLRILTLYLHWYMINSGSHWYNHKMSSPKSEDAMSPTGDSTKTENSDSVNERLQRQPKEDNSDDNLDNVRTTSFSVADILDPRKFTGCSAAEKSRVWVPWKNRKRRLTDSGDSTSDDDRADGPGIDRLGLCGWRGYWGRKTTIHV